MDFRKVSIIGLALMLIAIIGLSGCGASKAYVDQSVADERAQSSSALAKVEKEIAENTWLCGPVDAQIIFTHPPEQRWQAAAQLLGVDLNLISGQAGHA